ncbi:MAG TPA: tetratricopeptide repeat protein [Longimicrobiales bacterium]
MTRHPTARRVHREAAPDDVFVARVLETSAWAKHHGRTLVIAGIIAAVVVVGLVYLISSRRALHARAATQLTQVRALAMSGNTQLAVRDLEQFVAEFGGTPSGDEGRLLLAKAYLESGQTSQAQEAVRPVVRDLDSGLGVNAALLLAAAHEAAQEPHRAEEVYLRIGEEARFLFQRQDALDNAARLRLQRGDAAGAVQLYERLVEMTPVGNAERPIYELRLGETRALAAIGGPTGDAVPPAAAPPATAPQPTTTGN